MRRFEWIWAVAGILAVGFLTGQQHAEAAEGKVASKPLYRDPIYDGAADPVLVWHPEEKK